MQRKDTDRARQPHPMAGQPREEDEDDLQKPEDVPSFLTARELEARGPAKPQAETKGRRVSTAEADEDDAGDDKDDARDLDR